MTTKEVQVVLVNEIEGAHVPLLLVRSSMKAKATDWSAQVLNLSYACNCLVDIFNS